ncbi:hypothetical protein BGZ96_002412 [Linnemannia gamsii]|uniref:Uncharacterized protein n=1 Tax=Linnemannia gamsii TaxID=64522 RepID=A0ABQ7JLL0_9FUNG|nr:hypothetical protein BGZ96_002412 [Linnemannia gamsii]
MTAKLGFTVANSLGKAYKPNEPMVSLMNRIHTCLGADDEPIAHQNFYLNVKHLRDLSQTMAYYRVFGHSRREIHQIDMSSGYDDV